MSETYFHVTADENVDSIMESGLKPSPSINHRGSYVFLTDSVEGAEEVANAYFADDYTILECKVAEFKVIDDPDPHGDLDSFAHNGQIKPQFIEVLNNERNKNEGI